MRSYNNLGCDPRRARRCPSPKPMPPDPARWPRGAQSAMVANQPRTFEGVPIMEDRHPDMSDGDEDRGRDPLPDGRGSRPPSLSEPRPSGSGSAEGSLIHHPRRPIPEVDGAIEAAGGQGAAVGGEGQRVDAGV